MQDTEKGKWLRAWKWHLHEFYKPANDVIKHDYLLDEWTGWLIEGRKLIDKTADILEKEGVFDDDRQGAEPKVSP